MQGKDEVGENGEEAINLNTKLPAVVNDGQMSEVGRKELNTEGEMRDRAKSIIVVYIVCIRTT